MNDQCTALFTHTHTYSHSLCYLRSHFFLFLIRWPDHLSALWLLLPPVSSSPPIFTPVQTIYIKDFSAHTFHHRSHFETLTLPPLSLPLSLRLKTTTTLIHKLFLGGDSSEALRKHEDRKVADQITPT